MGGCTCLLSSFCLWVCLEQVWDAHAPNLGLVSLTHFVGHKFSQVMALQVRVWLCVVCMRGCRCDVCGEGVAFV
jgi:hypothetical protein